MKATNIVSHSNKIFKPTNVDMNTYKVNPKKKIKAKNLPGIKKGSGGIDASGLIAGGGLSEKFTKMIQEEIQDITNDPEYSNVFDDTDGNVPDTEDATVRSVKGAHLIYKRQEDISTFEELWIFEIDPQNPKEHAKIEKQILAGTDIEFNTMASEDGQQRAKGWTAGNARYLHLTGLVN